jgi:periplasmic protein TonB
MKKFYYLTLLVVVSQFCFSQAPMSTVNQLPVSYESVESQPVFPTGMADFTKFVTKNLKLPEIEESGEIVVTFIIETDGSVKEAKVVRDLGNDSGNEVKKVLLSQPKWKPGESGGKPVRVLYTFVLKIR